MTFTVGHVRRGTDTWACTCGAAHIEKTLNPEWNAEFELVGVKGGDMLECKIWDYDLIGKPDFLGKVNLTWG